MINKTDILQFIREKKSFLREKYGVTDISLFGSFARGEETEESDIDFLVEMPADFHKRCELEEYLEENLHRKADVLRKHPYMKQRLLEEINKDAVYV